MVKKIITTSLVATALLLSACGENSDGESALDTQQMLDNKDYAGVINKLKDGNTTSDNLALAAAYMGKAGFSPASIIGIVATSADSGDSSTFASFIGSSKDASNSQSLKDMKKAVLYYKKVVPIGCDTNATLSGAESDVCLYIGLSQVSQTAVAVSYIADNVSVLSDNNGTVGSDPKLTASTCAMQYAFDGTKDSNCTFSSESNITFAQSGLTYGDINITVNSKPFEYLITPSEIANNRSTVLTNGFCSDADFSTRVSDKNDTNYISNYHVCPIDEDNATKATTTEDTLVQALNEGIDSIGVAVSDNTKDDVDKFKQDIIDSRDSGDTNTTITIDDITKYLNKYNK